jgi:hypothetical protein
LAELPKPGAVRIEQGQNPWPGPLRFEWSGPPGARFSTFLEGWNRLPGHDEIVELSGYQPGSGLPAWGDWSTQTTASFEIPPQAHGHYTLHVRALAGREGMVWSRASALVEPQVPVDNADAALTRAEGEWERTTSPRMYARRDYVYADPGEGERTFRWRLRAPRAGRYAVQACWPGLEDFARAAGFSVAVDGEQVARVTVDQTANGFSAWQALAEVEMVAGAICEVALSNAAEGKVAADAVRLLLMG